MALAALGTVGSSALLPSFLRPTARPTAPLRDLPGAGAGLGGAFAPRSSLPVVQSALPQPPLFAPAPQPVPPPAPQAPSFDFSSLPAPQPVPPPAPQAPSFDFSSFPGVIQARAQQMQGLGDLLAALQAERERALVNLGDSGLAAKAGFELSPLAQGLIEQANTTGTSTSTLARLANLHEANQRKIVNSLAARGILRSGELGFQTGEENRVFGLNEFDARQRVLDLLAQLSNRFQQQKAGLDANVTNAFLTAYQEALANPDLYARLFGGTVTQPGTRSFPTASTASPPQPSGVQKALGVTNRARALRLQTEGL